MQDPYLSYPQDKGWFQLSKDTLKPLLDKRSEFLYHVRQLRSVSEEIIQQYRDLKNDVKDAVSAAKIKWTEELAKKIHDMNFTPKAAQQAIKTLKKGCTSHHEEHVPFKFKRKDGTHAASDKEDLEMLQAHFF